MPRKSNLWILCLLAFVLGTIGTSAARAEPLVTADSYPAAVDGSHLGAKFRFNGVSWECRKAAYQGKLTQASSVLTVSPSFSECRWNFPPVDPPVWSGVTVSMNGCDFYLHTLERQLIDQYTSQFELKCPSGQQMVVDLFSGPNVLCRLTVGSGPSKWANGLMSKTGAVNDVEAQMGGGGMKFTQDLSSLLLPCPVKAGTYEFFTIEAFATLTATAEAGKQIGLQVTGE